MYKPHTFCRACGSGKPSIPTLKVSTAAGPQSAAYRMVPVFDLGVQPLANDFCEPSAERAGYAPLKVMFCPECTLAQLSVVVNPEILYRKYCYVTSPSDTMKRHFNELITDIRSETQGNKLLEIGSNDGALLEHFKDRGFDTVVGVDPARNLCDIATARGVKAVCNFFSKESANDIAQWFMPDVILARHVFCHVDNWKDFVAGLDAVAGKDTVICIEVPYAGDLISRGEFDTIYHEHLSLLTVTSVVRLLRDTGLYLSRVIKYQIHGGAILLVIRKNGSGEDPHISVKEYLNSEEQTMTLERWKAFSIKASDQINNLRLYVDGLVQNGKTVAALGASAKSTVWVNACNFTRREILWIADTTPQKLWMVSPGAGIPIVDEGAILRELPDYVICFAWNFREEILRKNELARSKGVKFIFPVPEIEVV